MKIWSKTPSATICHAATRLASCPCNSTTIFCVKNRMTCASATSWNSECIIAKYAAIVIIALLFILFLRYLAETIAEAMNPPVPKLEPLGVVEEIKEDVPDHVKTNIGASGARGNADARGTGQYRPDHTSVARRAHSRWSAEKIIGGARPARVASPDLKTPRRGAILERGIENYIFREEYHGGLKKNDEEKKNAGFYKEKSETAAKSDTDPRILELAKSLPGPKKAAIVMVALGTDASSKILKNLDEHDVERLSTEIARLDNVSPEIREAVIEEFHNLAMAPAVHFAGRHRLRARNPGTALGPRKAKEILEKVQQTIRTTGFNLLEDVDPKQLVNFIQKEHPQTIALLLAHMEPKNAARRSFPRSRRNCKSTWRRASPPWKAFRPIRSIRWKKFLSVK